MISVHCRVLITAFFPADTVSAKGYLSGSVITVLGSDTKLYSANYYDKKGRVTKTVSSNLLSGYETTTTIYTFTGKPASVKHVHMAAGKTTQMEIYTYTYDHAERLTKVEHSLNGVKVTLAANTYDELGRLSGKSLHGSASNKLAYAYNIRNWIESISSGGLFNISLYYGYNGNVSRMVCRCPGDNKTYGYNFAYDNLSRLTSAQSLIGGVITLGYATNYSYDKNGNLLHLRRGGQTGLSGTGIIDNLSFTLNGNQLKSVNDDATATASNGFEFKDGAKLATEYMYDANGSLIKDLNKGIEIQYNLLNLPSQVKFSDGSTITYTYGADGVKLRTVHKIGGVATTTDYCDNVIYENGTAKQLLTEEGYVSLSDKKYHYYLKDHQGNNRVVTDQAGGMEEANYYYPFGGVFLSNGNDVQAYKYNGKELDTKKGLNWYDYGAREYDVVLGRFTTMDPSSESYYSTSPYAYCGNNPVNRIDPIGADWYRVKSSEEKWEYVWDSDIHSQSELDKLKNDATYLGKTYIDENKTYYSLFGSKVNAETLEGSIYQLVDKGIIATAEYNQEEQVSWGGEDIPKPKVDFSIEEITASDSKYLGIDSHRNEYNISYENSAKGVYRVVNGEGLMKASMRDWIGDSDMPKHIGGWQSGSRMYHIRFMNKGGYDIVHLQFSAKNANALLQKYNKLFSR
ncbi:MAG: RHS repeat-associated core domain-containing protein [Bacteroides cellulosilyticus]